MYTIKQASLRTGISVPLLRAWERRYGIPSPARTASGYRLYDEAALLRVREMRALVGSGWSPSQAARAVLEGRAEAEDSARVSLPVPDETLRSAPTALPVEKVDAERFSVERFVAAAAALDEAALDETLSEAFATLGPDEAVTRFALPALVGIGEAWAEGRLDVAGEHAASNAVMRRLGALYEVAGQPAAEAQVIVGLPPRGQHEAGALAFAVACRRAGLRVLYLGANVPIQSWAAAVRAQPLAAVVLGAVTRDEGRSAAEVAHALRREHPELVLAIGGAGAGDAGVDGLVLPPDIRRAVATLKERLSE